MAKRGRKKKWNKERFLNILLSLLPCPPSPNSITTTQIRRVGLYYAYVSFYGRLDDLKKDLNFQPQKQEKVKYKILHWGEEEGKFLFRVCTSNDFKERGTELQNEAGLCLTALSHTESIFNTSSIQPKSLCHIQ